MPNSTEPWVTSSADQMVTSFSSKSELALNLSPDGKYVTFVGYNAAVDTVDVSNANTPGDVDTDRARSRARTTASSPSSALTGGSISPRRTRSAATMAVLR